MESKENDLPASVLSSLGVTGIYKDKDTGAFSCLKPITFIDIIITKHISINLVGNKEVETKATTTALTDFNQPISTKMLVDEGKYIYCFIQS